MLNSWAEALYEYSLQSADEGKGLGIEIGVLFCKNSSLIFCPINIILRRKTSQYALFYKNYITFLSLVIVKDFILSP